MFKRAHISCDTMKERGLPLWGAEFALAPLLAFLDPRARIGHRWAVWLWFTHFRDEKNIFPTEQEIPQHVLCVPACATEQIGRRTSRFETNRFASRASRSHRDTFQKHSAIRYPTSRSDLRRSGNTGGSHWNIRIHGVTPRERGALLSIIMSWQLGGS